MRVAHREGLAREDAKLLNRREEIRLVQRGQQEAHRAVRAAQAAKYLVAVNVVNRGFGVAAQKVVQIALERRDGECAVRVGNERRLFARRGNDAKFLRIRIRRNERQRHPVRGAVG